MTALTAFANDVRLPGRNDKIFKDECLISFDSPDSETGLYVCMKTFLGVGRDYVEKFSQRTGSKIFLHIKRIRRLVEKSDCNEEVPEKIVRLAIGVEGGFKTEDQKYEFEYKNAIVTLPNFNVFSLDDKDIPMAISMCARAILDAQSANKQEEIDAASATWEGDVVEVSKHAENLLQLENPPKIPPKDWVCSKCSLTNNLWLNLTDGSILCGRRFFDGSGGNNHAVEHYTETKYPLAVKLGTITPDGKGDVYSYAEDNMVKDPHLAKHLAHFGINITQMEKTEKSMVELEIEMNQKYDEWAKLTESGSKLEPVYGPGYTGMENLGNTCYMNSVMQVLFTIPSFLEHYVNRSSEIFDSVDFHSDQTRNFSLQMAKLGVGLMSGKYSVKKDEEDPDSRQGIKPSLFKLVVGRGHPEFSGKGQQDAQEFYLHLLSVIEREEKMKKRDSSISPLQFVAQDRIQCSVTSKVKYMTRVEDYIPFAIPVDSATNKDAVEAYKAKKAEADATGQKLDPSEVVRPRIPFSACLDKFSAVELVDDYYSPAADKKTSVIKTCRLKTFPDFLLIQLKKFDVDEHWVPYKLDVEVDMPDEMDLSSLKSNGGLQEGEEPWPEDSSSAEQNQAAALIPDETIVSSLAEMGFPIDGCRKAAFHTNNAGVEAAMNWVMEHMEDQDFGTPFVNPTLPKTSFEPSPEGLSMLMEMSFSRNKSIRALKETDNNVERAVDWLFSHPDVEDEDPSAVGDPAPNKAAEPGHSDGTKYELVAFVSHMGTSHMVGHYVCHILKEGRWVIFNDSKVALSEHPPKGLGYLYLYRRKEN